MNKSLFLACLLSSYTIATKNDPAACQYQDHYPSYQCKNNYGTYDNCLRAWHDLPAGVMVGSSNFIKTDNEFIALHQLKEFRHVAIMGLKPNGSIQWGRVQGKMALVNHSCNPNCELTNEGNVITIKPIIATQELTIAYDAPIIGIEWNPQWNFECFCKSKECRIILNSYDWRKKARKLYIIE